MQEVNQVLDQVKDLYAKVLGRPAPAIDPRSYAEFPPGVDPVRHTVQEVQQLKQLSEQLAFAPVATAWVPPADSFLAKDAHVIRMEIPGVAKESLEVFVAGTECVVRGERKPVEDESELRPLRVERFWGPFERRFALPAGTLPDRVSARQSDGVLELKIQIDQEGIRKENKVVVA